MEQTLQRQRVRMVDAGLGLLDAGQRVGALDAAAVTQAAGLGADDFRACYAQHDDFLAELLQRVLDRARDASAQATNIMPSGVAKIRRGVEVYLDHNLAHPALRELLLILQTHPRGIRLNRTHAAGWIMVFELELTALGLAHAAATAHLAIVMTVETALAEFEARRALPEFRETLYAYFDCLHP